MFNLSKVTWFTAGGAEAKAHSPEPTTLTPPCASMPSKAPHGSQNKSPNPISLHTNACQLTGLFSFPQLALALPCSRTFACAAPSV